MATSDHLAFRVEGLPSTCDREAARSLIHTAVGLDHAASDVTIHSLARSVFSAHEKTATISSTKLAALLQPPLTRAQRWTFEIQTHDLLATSPKDRGGDEISLDTHFEGLTPLNSFEDDELHLHE